MLQAMNVATRAVIEDRYNLAEPSVVQAYDLLLDVTLPRSILIYMITEWGAMSSAFQKAGHADAADRCGKMSKLLQARFDAGDYYRES